METKYFRRITHEDLTPSEQWECLVFEKLITPLVWQLTDSRSKPILVRANQLEPYPTHVRATAYFPATEFSLGGQIHEEFSVEDPENARMGLMLKVQPANGKPVMIPLKIAEPTSDPISARLAVAV